MHPVAKGLLTFCEVARFCGKFFIAAFYPSGTSSMQNSFPALHGSGLARDLGTVTKKKWYILIVVVLLAVGCYYLYEHWGDFTGASAEPSEPNAPARIVWTPIDRSGEGFRLQMPAGSHEIQVPAYNENGGTDQVSMLYAYPDSATS